MLLVERIEFALLVGIHERVLMEKGARDGRRPMRIIKDPSNDGLLPRSGFVQQIVQADAHTARRLSQALGNQRRQTTTKKADNEKPSHLCPFCKEEVKEAAIKCKHCNSSLPSKPRHGGTCPFCAERINSEAVKCRYCKSILLPFGASGEDYSSVSIKRLGSLPPIWESPFSQQRCIVRTYCESGKMHSIRCCATPDGQMKCGDPIQVGTCSEGGKYEMGYHEI
jgi:hypothetical protein